MVEYLDNAKVIMISEKGQYGHIEVLGTESVSIEVCYLAICKYDNSEIVYLFLCDENFGVEQDIDFNTIGHAVADAESRTKRSIIWNHINPT